MLCEYSEMGSTMLRISHYVNKTEVLGPGKRFVIWVQGCEKRCYHCINPAGWDKSGGKVIAVEKLLQRIKDTKGICGVTISGGEPFLQYDALKKLVYGIKAQTTLDVMLYSGYTVDELLKKYGQDIFKFMQNIDLFVDGEYREEEDHGTIYRGSDNQNIYSFTGKFDAYQQQIESTHNRDIEFSVENEEIYMVGVPPKGFYREFMKVIREGKI